MSEQNGWRQKYYDTLERMVSTENRWKAVDELLRRVIIRLCISARGQDPQLDTELGKLTQAMRRPAVPEELEPLLVELTAAVARLDEHPAAALPRANGHGTAATAAANASLVSLLEHLSVLPPLQARVAGLRNQLAAAPAGGEPADAVEAVAALLNGLWSELQGEKAEIERVLQQVTARLDEIADYLASEAASQQQGQDNSRDLNARLLGEFQQIDSSVRQATDLEALRQQVGNRLELIGGHLQEFRAREEARLKDYRERAESMHTRISELERETRLLEESVQREQRLALTDTLTGIPNRLAYQERVQQDYRRWRRFNRPLCIAMWDIDEFKAVNDTYGHRAGDRVIRIVGQHLARHVRETDFVARYGGEEFVMLLDGVTIADALALADKLRQRIERIGFHFRDQPVKVTVSCGVAAFGPGDTPEIVSERADQALYQAKKNGRNCCIAG